MLDTTTNVTLLDPENEPGSPSIWIDYHGFRINLGEASDQLLASFILELTNKLAGMIERNNRHGWATGPKAYEYDKSQVHFHLRGLMKERARRLDAALRNQPAVMVVASA